MKWSIKMVADHLISSSVIKPSLKNPPFNFSTHSCDLNTWLVQHSCIACS
jgi:hypothetical protein